MPAGQRLAARFEGLLSKLGTSFGEGQLNATVHRAGGTTGPSYNPTVLPPTDHACIVLWSDFTAEERAGGLVEDGDSRLEVGATTLDVEPQAGDKVTVGSTTYQVKAVEVIRPGGVPILYRLKVIS